VSSSVQIKNCSLSNLPGTKKTVYDKDLEEIINAARSKCAASAAADPS